jgi:inhibitor of KinA sporulation pathway (predicted exonuclease)
VKIIILDLEFENQRGFEIIQVGAVKVDLHRRTLEPFFDELVKLPEGMPLSSFISNLTKIKAKDLNKARTFKEVMTDFWAKVEEAHCGQKVGGWGNDVQIIKEQSARYGVSVPKKLDAYDIKHLFNFFRAQSKISNRHKTGLQSTLQAFGLDFEGQPHNAYDDAFMTAKLLMEAINNPGPKDPKD